MDIKRAIEVICMHTAFWAKSLGLRLADWACILGTGFLRAGTVCGFSNFGMIMAFSGGLMGNV